MKIRKTALLAAFVTGLGTAADSFALPQQPGVSPGPGLRYATDAYPGFDDDDELLKPSRREPKWFGWFAGPEKETPEAQLEYARSLAAEGSFSAAVGELDALVREWPTSKEAPVAQEECAELCFRELGDLDDAFAHFRYLVDFYSLQCDFRRATDRMYEVAGRMLEEGKAVMFIRFENTVDSRRAFEAAVLRAPGAAWAPEAMLTIASLREKEGKDELAVAVYENLRSLYPDTPEARTSLVREAEARMRLLDDHGYNRSRCRDTAGFLTMALKDCNEPDAPAIRDFLGKVDRRLEEEAYLAAKFYDSRTRTVRSAVSAYEKFLSEYPSGTYAGEVKSRLEELKGGGK